VEQETIGPRILFLIGQTYNSKKCQTLKLSQIKQDIQKKQLFGYQIKCKTTIIRFVGMYPKQMLACFGAGAHTYTASSSNLIQNADFQYESGH